MENYKVTESFSKAHEISDGCFDLSNKDLYEKWRNQKLKEYPKSIEQIVVLLDDPFNLKDHELLAMQEAIQTSNMAIYHVSENHQADKAVPKKIASQLGMTHLDQHLCVDNDGISPLQVSQNKVRQDYIPYTNKPINWHTDGYYNTLDHTIRGMVLHCVSSAASGGENAFLDHEIAYIHLRDINPNFIRVLMLPDVMTIPPNDVTGEIIRPEQTGPVFSVLDDGRIHMRYTARTKNIVWKDAPLVQEAVTELLSFLNSESPYVFHHKLQPGQGVISNNVLHKRTGFIDDPEKEQKRLIYRARYYDRIINSRN